jgi:hypothetical protein
MRRNLAFALLAFAAPTTALHAAPITYTETVTASGTLGSTPFANALVTLTQTADTANIVQSGVVIGIPATTSTVTVAGIGAGTFTIPTATFVVPIASLGGLLAGPIDLTSFPIVALLNPAFATYDLQSSIGPLSGTAFINTGLPFATTAGGLVLTSTSSPATFQAVIPEPSSLVLTGVAALAGVGFASRRRMRAA